MFAAAPTASANKRSIVSSAQHPSTTLLYVSTASGVARLPECLAVTSCSLCSMALIMIGIPTVGEQKAQQCAVCLIDCRRWQDMVNVLGKQHKTRMAASWLEPILQGCPLIPNRYRQCICTCHPCFQHCLHTLPSLLTCDWIVLLQAPAGVQPAPSYEHGCRMSFE